MNALMPLARWAAALALSLAVSGAGAAPVSEYTLDNGLRVIVKEDHRAPVAVSQIWYAVGASYEHAGITGVSHVLEHMMFKGTEKHPPGEFSRIISGHGGRENAFTGRDYTAYFQQLAADKLEVALRLEADRMRNLLLPQEEFEKERQVVIEERRLRVEDRPRSLTHERFMATAFLNGPYSHPIIGWMGDLEALTVSDLEDWYDRFYRPNNATLVVVGDVDPEAVRALAAEHFGSIEPAPVSAPKPRPEVPQKGVRRVTVSAPAKVPYIVAGYKAPVLRTAEPQWHAYALEVLAGVLSAGDSARLSRELVRGRELVASASAGYDLYARHPSALTLAATPADGVDVAQVEQALLAQVERLREEPVGADELERVKAQVIAGDVYQKDSVFYQAMQIGMLETVGLDWRVMDEYVERVRAVTAEQLRTVAREYLVEDRLTIGVLEPQPTKGDGGAPGAAPGGHPGGPPGGPISR